MQRRHLARSLASLVFVLLLSWESALAGLDSHKAQYIGGTVSAIKEETEGQPSTADEKVFTFTYKGGKLTIPYDQMNSLEYGQKAGRRLGLAIAVTPLALFSKKRRHFLTVGYQDENNKQQAAVFEMGKDIVRVTLATLEARSGRKIDYEDEEARKSGKGN